MSGYDIETVVLVNVADAEGGFELGLVGGVDDYVLNERDVVTIG